MRIFYFSEKISLWGKYTGYVRLPDYMGEIESDVKHFQIGRKNRWLNRFGRFFGRGSNHPLRHSYRNLYEWYFYFFYTHRFRPASIVHLINFGASYPILARAGEKAPKHVIATIHDPLINEFKQSFLSRLSSAIVLYRRDIEWFESFVGKGRVKFVHHGIDVDFFYRIEMRSLPENPRLMFVGRIYRNTAMLARLVKIISKRMPQVGFDLVVSESQKNDDPNLEALMGFSSVRWHSQISDEQLRDLYQQSYLLLMPLVDSGANNALLEALACGLPIVTNGVGGVLDYGGDTIFPTVPEDDDVAMLALIDRYLSDFGWRNEVAAEGRDFAVSQLGWPVVAQRHREIYEELCL